MTLLHYLRNLQTIMGGFEELPNDNPHIQRFYAKDIDCPPVWRDRLSEHLPKGTFYLAPEAELMSSLPPAARAENMKCYRGYLHSGTQGDVCVFRPQQHGCYKWRRTRRRIVDLVHDAVVHSYSWPPPLQLSPGSSVRHAVWQ
jgi:hypothetical protein